MKCEHTHKLLDEYLDAVLAPTVTDEVERHLAACSVCSAELRELTTLRQQLAKLPAPSAPPDVLERMLRTAVRTPATPIPLRRGAPWHRSGLAAAAVMLLALGMGLGVELAGRKSVPPGPQVVLAAQTIQLGQAEERVGLVFRTSDALRDASISVSLPQDVQIAGRPNVHHLSWHADLESGPNLLELPLLATGTHSGTLVVRLAQGSLVRTLEIPITIRPPKDPGAASLSAWERRALT